MNCDYIARWYRWCEYVGFGRALERRRNAFLPDIAGAQQVLALGDGDGRALRELVSTATNARITYIDSSARMLGLARARAGTERIAYCRADALSAPLTPAGYDLIVTHFFLDCFEEEELEHLIVRVASAATPKARWLISEFRKSGWLVKLLYFFFRISAGLQTRRLVNHHPFLIRNGFRLTQSESAWRGLLASELWVREPSEVCKMKAYYADAYAGKTSD